MIKKILFVALALVVTGCGATPYRAETKLEADRSFLPNLDWLLYGDRKDKMIKLAKSDFSVKAIGVFDRRVPHAFVDEGFEDDVIYEYNPDKLFQNMPMYVQSMLAKHMNFGPQKPQKYYAEIILKNSRIYIKHGNILSGRWGQYQVELEMDVVVRDEASNLVLRAPMKVDHRRPRKAQDGRHPSAKVDRARIMKVLNEAFQVLGVDLAWEVRRAHMRRNLGDISSFPEDS